ncbi:hypothetical protein [Actinoplanes couchii]|uniref:WXG100 family type VII secretion target n=1 Tax=Actinoplanes couchii TaxID=403638 RepID=A0ABQ3XMJ6_9ACTN|nr:hypothetical protein [Actinoplanes couchii]MDR6321633.1 hypothetical protein [Actinoplanes couchii]GID59728.1 hypothetical protein Aco03nite_081320 [Actinoplanes couchii]
MTQPQFSADVRFLADVATAVGTAAATLGDARTASRGNLALGDQRGWDATAAVRDAAVAWDGHLTGLAEAVRLFGGEVESAGRLIGATDDEAARDIHRIPR